MKKSSKKCAGCGLYYWIKPYFVNGSRFCPFCIAEGKEKSK